MSPWPHLGQCAVALSREITICIMWKVGDCRRESGGGVGHFVANIVVQLRDDYLRNYVTICLLLKAVTDLSNCYQQSSRPRVCVIGGFTSPTRGTQRAGSMDLRPLDGSAVLTCSNAKFYVLVLL